ncbi:MAG: TonB-dependent receptor plug domain-containing protein [Bacteroidales bacterium]|nr:TonB-dependent receptor plug domain-containing protein [Bacteroidales bacterium]
MTLRLRTSWLLVLMLWALLSQAQDTITLNAVNVTAEGIQKEELRPLVMKKMDSLVLETKSTSTLSELLIQHSPVFIKTYGPGGISTASFRGTTASHTLVLWNGFQLNAPTLGQVDFSTIPVFLADDIDLKWGSGTSNNSGGLGGSVNIDSKNTFGKGLILDLKQTYGSFNTWGSFVTVGYCGKKVSFRVKAYRNSSDNDFEYYNSALLPPKTMKQQNADFVDYGVMPEVSVMLRHGILSLSSWNQWNNRNLPPIMPNVGNKNTEEWTRDSFSRNFLTYKLFWDGGKLQLKSAAFVENQRYYLEVHTLNPDVLITHINSENKALVLHQIADLEQRLYATWKLKAKLQWDRERVNSNNYQDIKRRDMLSSYVAVEGHPVEQADLSVTARYDIVDGKSMGVFPTATFSYHFPKGFGMTLGYSHNYRNPSLNDLYWYPGGNPDLLPENGRTVDLAFNYNLDCQGLKLDFRTGAYASKVKNWIQWVPTSYRYWVPQNVALVFARGIENHIDFNYTHNDWKYSLSGNYVFTFTTDESENAQSYGNLGKQLIYIPRHHGNLFANIRWTTWDLSYTLEVTGLRNTSYADFYAYDLPSYVLHHVALGKQFGKFRCELRCNNFTDKDYQNVLWRPMPGRSFEIMLNYRN